MTKIICTSRSMRSSKISVLLLCLLIIGISIWIQLSSKPERRLRNPYSTQQDTSLNLSVSKSSSDENNTKWIITTETDVNKLTTFDEVKNWSVLILNSNKVLDKCQSFSQFSNIWNATIGAINNGAKYIFLTSIVNSKTPDFIKQFKYDKFSSALKYTGALEDPISSHFQGVNNTRRLDWVKSFSYHLGVWNTSIVQKVINREETMNPNKLLEIDDRAPSVILETGRSYPFIKDNVMFFYDAFWSIVPIQDNTLWSLWVQRLLLELGSSVSFISMTSSNRRCETISGINNSISEKLSNWKCLNRIGFFGCIRALNQFLLSNVIITQIEAHGIERWLNDLIKTGYKEPKLVSNMYHEESLEPLHRVLFYPKVDPTPQNLNTTFNSICPTGITECPAASINKRPLKRISNLLLVIVFNWPNSYYIADYLEKLYSPRFSQILFCGLNMEKYMPYFLKMRIPISFVEMHDNFHLGQHGFRCLEAAMQMNYVVDGYLHLGDDVVLNVWYIQELPTDNIWFQKSLREANLTQTKVANVWITDKYKYWGPWENVNYGRIPLINSFKKLKQESKNNEIAKLFFKQLAENTGGGEKGFYEVSDIFYIPEIYAQRFLYLVKYFRIYHEIAVPTIINGLVSQKDIVKLNGTYLWYEERQFYRERYSISEVFLHPVKIGPCYRDTVCKTFLCSKYFSCL